MAETGNTTNTIPSGWIKKLGQKIYIISHAKSCFYSETVDGTKITVYDKISSLIKAVVPTTANKEWEITDCNAQLDQSVVYIPYTLAVLNMPPGCTNGWLQTIPSSGDAIKQIFYRAGSPNTTDNRIYIRTYHKASNVWSDWSEILTSTTKWISNYCLKHNSINCTASTVTYPKVSTAYSTDYIKSSAGVVGVKIQKSGCYLLSARAGFVKPDVGKAGYRQVQVMKKGVSDTDYTSVVSSCIPTSANEGGITALNTSAVVRRLNAGDTIAIAVKQYCGATLSCYYSYLELSYLGA